MPVLAERTSWTTDPILWFNPRTATVPLVVPQLRDAADESEPEPEEQGGWVEGPRTAPSDLLALSTNIAANIAADAIAVWASSFAASAASFSSIIRTSTAGHLSAMTALGPSLNRAFGSAIAQAATELSTLPNAVATVANLVAARGSSSMRRDETLARLMPTMQRIAGFSELEPNWDTYGAKRPAPAALDVASRYLRLLVEAYAPVAGERALPY